MTIEQLGKGINKKIAQRFQAQKQKNIKLCSENKIANLKFDSNTLNNDEIIIEK